MSNFIETSKPFQAFGEKSMDYLASRYPNIVDNGGIRQISIGRTKDASAGDRSSFRVTGSHAQAMGNYLETPDKMIPDNMLSDPLSKRPSVECRISQPARDHILREIEKRVEKGETEEAAAIAVRDSVPMVKYYDTKKGCYVVEPVIKRVNDSVLPSLGTPYWNVTMLNKIFRQPFITGMSRNLVSTVGVPNVWAEIVGVYTETFEGFARLSNTAKGNVEFNASNTVGNKMHVIISELVNMVVEYETGVNEGLMAGQAGNPLSSIAIGDRERYARLMLEQLYNAMLLFGAPEAGFDGLAQMTTEETYSGTPLNAMWADNTNVTVGAQAVKALNRIIGNAQEGLNFLPASVAINVSPTVYKVLKYAMQSDVYSYKNPLGILADGFEDSSKIATNEFIKGLDFTLVPNPLCAPQTPWNRYDEDLMFITFPKVKSALEPLDDIIMSPVAIENYILPSFPQRDGLLRTMLKRVGSLMCPVEGSVKIIRGFGVNP
jgi:hypothetical protein